MFTRFSRSWELFKASLEVLKKDRELLIFPTISFIAATIVSIVFFLPLSATGILEMLTRDGSGDANPIAVVLSFVILFLYYLVMYTVVIFSNSALIGAAMIRLDGGDPTVRDGFRIASERFGKIFGWALVAATVGMVLNSIRHNNSDNIGMRILLGLLGGLLEFAWNLITFLVVPVLVVENLGPIDAIKRSAQLLKKTWGEQLIATFGIGLVIGLISLGIVLVGALLTLLLSVLGTVGIVLGIALTVLGVIAVSLFGSALGGIFQAALYRYAAHGETSEFFPREYLEGAFKHQ